MQRIIKGRFIGSGCGIGGGVYGGTPESRLGLIFEVVGLPAMFMVLIIGFFASWKDTGYSLAGDGLFYLSLFLLLSSSIPLAFHFGVGGSIDAIYEHGFTVRYGMRMRDVLRGNHWFAWEDVSRIEFGQTKGLRHRYYRDSGYFRVYTPNKSTHSYIEVEYRRGKFVEFYDLFWNKLTENCSDAEWVELDIPDGQWTGRPEICR